MPGTWMGSSQSRQKSARSSTQKMNAAFSWQPGGERLEREALVLAGELVGGVDLDVAARAQRSFVSVAYHRGSRALARVEQTRTTEDARGARAAREMSARRRRIKRARGKSGARARAGTEEVRRRGRAGRRRRAMAGPRPAAESARRRGHA